MTRIADIICTCTFFVSEVAGSRFWTARKILALLTGHAFFASGTAAAMYIPNSEWQSFNLDHNKDGFGNGFGTGIDIDTRIGIGIGINIG